MHERIHIWCSCKACRTPWYRNSFRQDQIKIGHRKKRRLYKQHLKVGNDEVIENALIYTD
jgi:hypothetical protein